MSTATNFDQDLALLKRLKPPTVARPEVVESLVRREWIMTREAPAILTNGVFVAATAQGKKLLKGGTK